MSFLAALGSKFDFELRFLLRLLTMFQPGMLEAAAAEMEQLGMGDYAPGLVGPALPQGGDVGVAAPLRPVAKSLSAPKVARLVMIDDAL